MVHENYTNKQTIEIPDAAPTAVIKWKKQYPAEINGQTPKSAKTLTPEQQ